MPPIRAVVALALAAALLSGCASTRFESHGPALPRQPLCQPPGEQVAALVLWGAKWRPDQKEPGLREAAAQRGIEAFFGTSGCYTASRVLRTVDGREARGLTPAELGALAARQTSPPRQVLLITVRELGPILKLFAHPALLEGGTEVVLDIRAFDPASGQITTDFSAHWQHGGPWVVKGVATLEQDMVDALRQALQPSVARP